jgi:DNA-binding beta-propeller fold protein YncE
MRFGRWLYLILAVGLLGSMGLTAAHAGPLAVFTNFREGYAPSTVTILDTATDQLVGNPIPVGVNPAGVAITPDGRTAVVACAESQDVYFIDLSANPPKLSGRLEVGAGLSGPFYPVGVAMSPDGGYAALTVGINATAVPRVSPGNTYVRVISVRDRTIVQSIQMPQDPFPITAEASAISPQGSIVIAGPQSSMIYALEFSGGQITLPEGTNDQYGATQGTASTYVAITPDGQTALIPAASTKIVVIPIDASGRIPAGGGTLVSSGGSGAQAIAITRDGKRAFVRNFFSPGNNVAVFDIVGGTLKDTGMRLHSSGFPEEILALVPDGNFVGIPTIAVTPDGRKVYTTNPFLNQVEVFDVEKPQAIRRFSTGPNPIGVAIQPQ